MKRLCALLLTLALTLSLLVVTATPAQAKSIVAKGIDVSVYQGNINWNAVKNSGHGDFAILRAYCYGKDTTFDTNYANAKAAGVPIGAYVYVYGNTVAAIQSEINALLSVIKGKQFEYPIYVDFEDEKTYQYNSRDYNTNLIKTACQMLENAGFYAGVYTYLYFTNSYVNMSQLTNYTTWIAEYNSSCHYTGAYDMWQYGCTGRVNGIGGDVDTNYCYTDLPSQIAAAGKNGYVAEMQKFDENEKLKYDSGSWKQQYHITTGRGDDEFEVAQEFRPSDTLFKGVQLYMKVGTAARIKIAIGTTQENNSIIAQEFNVEGNQHEGWYSFDFQKDVSLTKGKLYYLRVRIVSSNSYGLAYTNPNSLPSSCPIRAHIRSESGGDWKRTDKCIGFNMLTEYGMVRYPFPVNGNTMMIYDGDSTNKIETHFATKVSVDRAYRREGTAGLKIDCTNPVSQANSTVGGFALIRMSQSANLTKYNYLSYQLYLPKDMTSKSRFQVNFVTNPNGEDGFNSIVNITGWKAGWHTVTLEKSKIGKATDDADWSKIYNIRLIWFNDDKVATPTHFFFDNLNASINKNQEYPYALDDSTLMIHDGENDRAYFSGYQTIASLNSSFSTQGSKSIYMNCTVPKGQSNKVGGMLFLPLDNAVDMTQYNGYSFDFYLGRDFAGDHKFEITFSSDDCNLGFSDSLQMNGMKKGWVTLQGTFDEAVLRDGQADKWTSISTIRFTWYNNAQDADATVFAVDNFRLNRTSPAVDNVIALIAALPSAPEVTLDKEAEVVAARTAYNSLTDSEKARITNIDRLIQAETKLGELKAILEKETADKAAAKVVEDAIAALPETITVADGVAIYAARDLYDALTDDQKAYVPNLAKLEQAEADLETELNKLPEDVRNAIDRAGNLIQQLPQPEDVTLDHQAQIEEARQAYDALEDTYKALIPNYNKLVDCEEVLAELLRQLALDKANAKEVEDAINTLPVTATDIALEDEDVVRAIREMYESLNDTAKSFVPNLAHLEEVEAALGEKKVAAAIQAVNDAIDALPTPTDVTLDDAEAIEAARNAYEALNGNAKEFVNNLDKLEAAEAALDVLRDQLEQDKNAAQVVIDAIASLPPVEELSDALEAVVAGIRRDYEALTEAQKALVTNLDILEAAENALGIVPVPPVEVTLGDVNDDGKVDAKDALDVLKASVGKITFTAEQAIAAEVVGDDFINAKDALEILKFSVKKIDKFPIEL